MARRSPLNERYQKNTSPAGKTRKSAAAAKPKRDAGGATKSSGNKPKPKTGLKRPMPNPPTPEFAKMRRLWFILLIGSLFLTLGSVGVREYTGLPVAIPTVMLVVGYAMIFGAIFVDWRVLRPMRTRWQESGAGGSKPAGVDKTGTHDTEESPKDSSADKS